MLFQTTAMPIPMGIYIALETLASQAFTGSGHLHNVGVYSQRALLLSMISVLPAVGICLNSHWILLSLGQDPELAYLASCFLRYFILVIPAFIFNEVFKKFFAVQGKADAVWFNLQGWGGCRFMFR
ncbi:ethionine resistance protein [Entomophthora muscae]|uniref:Ethionine resistance protein n=1 Tax=Entomophthora muscae TaxID=34485 RepID=A0ACC2RFA4_9FUNG|nr:ethionine resistance protein [Entomophthora muscae]